jgi:NAD(P)H-dependent FMN reductase
VIRIAIITGSTRPGRRARAVSEWIAGVAERHLAAGGHDAAVELLDLADFDLPLLDEPVPAIFGNYACPHTRKWAAAVGAFDGFVFVTPEYNHSVPAALKNAIDYLYAEWNDKAAAFVSYGVNGGTRAVEHLRAILAEVRVAGVCTQVALSAFADFEHDESTDPSRQTVTVRGDAHEPVVAEMLEELISWSEALRSTRTAGTVTTAA